MLNSIFTFFVLALISFFPIVIWWYIFSYIDSDSINKKRFFSWIIWWALSVFPILYMDKILLYLDLKYLNVFDFVHDISGFVSVLKLSLSMFLYTIFLLFSTFILWVVFFKFKKLLNIYFKNLIIFVFLIIFISFLIYLLNFFPEVNIGVERIDFLKISFDSLKLVVFYYFMVAFIEETSKHFNFLQTSVFYIDSVKTWVLYSIFVALWFSFIENILYFYSIYNNYWVWSNLLKTYFFRSTFSVMLHIICNSFIAYYFSKALIFHRNKNMNFPYFKLVFIWLFFWILLHLIFDVFLSIGFVYILFIYFILWYLYVSSIFYREN